jgi:hypothetical protein
MVALVVWAVAGVTKCGVFNDSDKVNAMVTKTANRMMASRLLWVDIFSSSFTFFSGGRFLDCPLLQGRFCEDIFPSLFFF